MSGAFCSSLPCLLNSLTYTGMQAAQSSESRGGLGVCACAPERVHALAGLSVDHLRGLRELDQGVELGFSRATEWLRREDLGVVRSHDVVQDPLIEQQPRCRVLCGDGCGVLTHVLDSLQVPKPANEHHEPTVTLVGLLNFGAERVVGNRDRKVLQR